MRVHGLKLAWSRGISGRKVKRTLTAVHAVAPLPLLVKVQWRDSIHGPPFAYQVRPAANPTTEASPNPYGDSFNFLVIAFQPLTHAKSGFLFGVCQQLLKARIRLRHCGFPLFEVQVLVSPTIEN